MFLVFCSSLVLAMNFCRICNAVNVYVCVFLKIFRTFGDGAGASISAQDCLLWAARASPSHRPVQKPDAGRGVIKFSKRNFPGELLMRHVVSENRNRLQAALWHSFNQSASAFPCQSSESPDKANFCMTGKQILSRLEVDAPGRPIPPSV